MTKYGFENFTFLFNFFKKNIVRPKSAQQGERFRFQHFFPLYFEISANFSRFWEQSYEKLGQKLSRRPKNWIKPHPQAPLNK